jgi:hypothetical protein
MSSTAERYRVKTLNHATHIARSLTTRKRICLTLPHFFRAFRAVTGRFLIAFTTVYLRESRHTYDESLRARAMRARHCRRRIETPRKRRARPRPQQQKPLDRLSRKSDVSSCSAFPSDFVSAELTSRRGPQPDECRAPGRLIVRPPRSQQSCATWRRRGRVGGARFRPLLRVRLDSQRGARALPPLSDHDRIASSRPA